MEIKSVLIWTILTGCLDCMIRGHSSSLCLITHNASHNNGYSSVCKTESEKLVCERGKEIMITNVEFAKTATIHGTIYCNQCSRYSVSDLEITPTMFLAKLYQACSLQNQCKLEEDVKNPEAGSSDYAWFADIIYTCIESALFIDICSFQEQSEDSTPLHITLNRPAPDKIMFVSCTCIINGDIRLVAVDYRPYINDFECANSTLFIDGKQMFKCSDQSSNDSSVYNEDIHVTSNITNITVTVDGPPPQMLWIQITAPPGVSLVCNQNIYDSDHQTSMYTSTAMSDTTASLSVTDTSFQKDKYEGETFQITTIVGSALSFLALIVIIIIICAVYKRRKSRMAKTKTETNEYNAVSFEPQRQSETTLMKGVENKSYEEASENISSNSPSNYQEVCTDNVYSEPVDVIADDVYCEPAETDLDSQNTLTIRHNNGVHDYREPYDKSVLTREEENQCNYTKVVKENKKEDVYNAFTGIDNYSHVHVIPDKRLPQHLDNYSHIKLQCEQGETTKRHSNDIYTRLKMEQNSPDDLQCNQVKGDEAFVETEEYDHLAHYSHR